MDSLLNYAALLLGLAISLHTVYSIIRNHVVRRRERRALLEGLRLEFDVLIELASILRGKVNRFRDRYFASLPLEIKALPDQGKLDLEIIMSRIDQIVSATPHWDLPKIGATLGKRQMDLLVEFLDAFQLYRRRLELRTDEFRNAPNQHGSFARMLSCASLDDVKLSERFIALQKELGTGRDRSGAGSAEST